MVRLVGIAQKTGFGTVPLLPGIWPWLHLDTAVTLPVGVECYAAYALRAWLADGHTVSDRARRFARRSAIFSFALGMADQVAFHLMDQDRITRAPWTVTTLVSCRSWSLAWGRPWPTCCARTPTAAGHAQTSSPGPATRGPLTWSPADQSGDQPDQNPPDRTASEPRPPGRTRTRLIHDSHAVAEPAAPVPHAAEPGIEHDRSIARELAGAGQRVSRRALRSRGIRGSNEALNALALTLSAELANGTAGP